MDSVSKPSSVKIVGIIFVVALIIVSTVYITVISLYSEVIFDSVYLFKKMTDKMEEEFVINIKFEEDGGNKLSVYGTNIGSVPIEVVDIFLINDTANTVSFIEVDFRDSIIPVTSQVNLLEHNSISLTPGDYRLKAVSTNGNIEIISFSVQTESNEIQINSGV